MSSHPLGVRPSKIIAVHLNYRSRVAERGSAVPDVPSYFMKPPSSLAASGEGLVLPDGCRLLTFEGEIAIIMGATAKGVPIESAMDFVAGFAPANDVGVADFRWADAGSNLRSKGQDGFTPLGSTLLPVDAARDARVVLRTYVNGALVQDTTDDEMLFGFPQLVADISRFSTLEVGDVILTGTPAGASLANPGDVIEIEIVGGSRVSNPVVQSAVPIRNYGAMPKVDDAERTRARGGQVGHETATLSMDEEQRSSLEQLSTATLSSQLRKQGVDHHVISGLAAAVPEKKLVGVARTLRYLPLREDVFARIGNGYNAQKRAVDELSEGQVLVIDSRGVGDAGTIGDLLVKAAMVRGAAGVVTDGGVRDFDAITELGFPVYFAGPHPAVLGRRHVPADTGLPIACGGALVMPGDFIVGDGDGVIVIPRELADEVIGAAHQQDFEENYIAARIADGDGLDGLYPMDRETRQAFETWAAKSGEKLDGRSSAHGG